MKIKPYDDYKDIGIGWIDKIPSHWEIKRGKSIYKKEERPVREEDEVVTCFRDGQVTLRKNRRLDGFTESIKEIGYQGIRKGDLVIHQMDAFAGAVGVSDSDGKSTPVYSVCNGKVGLNNYYYAFIIREIARNGYIKSLSRGIRERSTDFRFSTFGKEYFPYPPKEEQNKIVEFLKEKLGKIDKFIDLKTRQIELLKEQKEAMINKVVTKGLDESVTMKYSDIEWIGKIPQHWEVLRLKYLADSNKKSLKEKEDDDKEIEYIDIGSVGFLNLKSEPVEYKFKDAPSRARRIVHHQDIIISTVRTYLKSMLYIDKSLENKIVSTGFSVITPKELKTSEFLKYALSASYFIENVIKNSIGVAYPAISDNKLIGIKVVIPQSIEEQSEIVKHIKNESKVIDETIILYKKEINLIKEYRTSLISSVVTGKIDVSEVEEA